MGQALVWGGSSQGPGTGTCSTISSQGWGQAALSQLTQTCQQVFTS